jgi:hypothetical protein
VRWGFDGGARVSLALGLGLALCARHARADGTSQDGKTVDPSYGRVDGDVDAVVGCGAVLGSGVARAEAEVRLRYLESAGVFVAYEDAFSARSTPGPRRVLAFGVELRPLFLLRWLKDHETGRPRLDLALDSLGFDLGALLEEPAGQGFASRRALEVGLGVELPLFERAIGPWIGVRGALRWSESALGSGSAPGVDDPQAVLAVTLAWHQVLALHLVDVGDEAP